MQYLGAQRPQTHSVYCGPDHREHRDQDHSESREQIPVNAVILPAVKTGNKLTVFTGHFFYSVRHLRQTSSPKTDDSYQCPTEEPRRTSTSDD